MKSLISYLRESETDGGRVGATWGDAGGEGATAVTSERQLTDSGFRSPTPRQQTAAYRENYNTMRRLVERAMNGSRWDRYRLQEAMTISDFSGYFGDVLNRSVLANYAETPYSWDQYCRRALLNDTRLAKVFRFDRGASVLDGPIVPTTTGLPASSGPTGLEQLTEYPARYRSQSNYSDQLYKFGARMGFSFELLLGDDLDALKDTPALLGRAARRTEEKRATKLYVSSTGPNATFFSTTNKNIVSSAVNSSVTGVNPPLSIKALNDAFTIMASQVDLDGEPISIEGVTLVVPPALWITANNIVRASQIWLNEQGGTLSGSASLQRLITTNWAQGVVTVAKNYYLPIVNTTTPHTQWYLFASPRTDRPALQMSFLRGREMPQLLMKAPNQVLIGEGQMGPGAGVMGGTTQTNPMEGDFENDVIDYKCRHFLGGTLLDPIMAVASNGSGS